MYAHRFTQIALNLAVMAVVATLTGCSAGQPEPATMTTTTSPAATVAPTTAASSPTPTSATPTLSGTLTVNATSYVDNDLKNACFPGNATPAGVDGHSGYEDISVGAQVTVYDGTGAIMATTNLAPGTLTNVGETQKIGDRTNAGTGPDIATYINGTTENFDAAQKAFEDAQAEWEASLPQITRSWGNCQFTFTATLSDADFYSVEVAHRGKVNYSRADLEAKAWHVDLTL